MEFEVPKCDLQVNLICPFKDNRFKRSRQNLFIFRCAHLRDIKFVKHF